MSMEYRTLARLFHADRSMDSYANHDRLVRQRLEADSTFTTGIGTPLGELFIATPRCVCMLTQKVLLAERRVSAMWRSIPGVMRWNYIYHAISEELLATTRWRGSGRRGRRRKPPWPQPGRPGPRATWRRPGSASSRSCISTSPIATLNCPRLSRTSGTSTTR